MKENFDGGSAFPVAREYRDDGMSLRDYFAAGAMRGMLAAPHQTFSDEFMLARDAYTVADAMIAARGDV